MNNLPDTCTDLDKGLQALALKIAIDEIKKLNEKNARLRDALKFYADPESWDKTDPRWYGDSELIEKYKHSNTGWSGSIIVGGKLAREALEQTKDN